MKTKTPKQTRIESARARHHAALETMCLLRPGVETWRKLRRIETVAHAAATAQCNGADYGGQPFRPDYLEDGSEGTDEQPTPWETFTESIRDKVAAVFGGELPPGFRFNQDPRGYALKIDPARKGAVIPPGMVTDWGGYGILAAEIND